MTDPDCLFCRIIAGDIPARQRPRGRPRGGHRGHQPRGAGPSAPHAAPAHRLGRGAGRGRRRHARTALRGRRAAGRRTPASPSAATGSSPTWGPTAASPCRTSTSTWSAGGASAGRPGERHLVVRAGRARRRLGGLAAAVALVAVSLAVSACASTERPTVQSDVVALPTPLRSWAPSTEAVLTELRAAVATAGHRLEVPRSAYRPSEPPLAAAGAARRPAGRPGRPRRRLRGRLRCGGCG